MNRSQLPQYHNFIPNDAFKILSSGYVLLDDIVRWVPPNLPPDMPVENILGFAPATINIDGWRYTVVFEGGCGCNLTLAIGDRQFRRPAGRSWSGKMVCKPHLQECHSCGRILCMSGNPDGFMFDPKDGSSPYPLCTEHHKEESKSLKWQLFWKGFFGGKR